MRKLVIEIEIKDDKEAELVEQIEAILNKHDGAWSWWTDETTPQPGPGL